MRRRLDEKVLVVLPAYNAERTLENIYRNISKSVVDRVLLVDDGSKDQTVKVSKKLGIKTLVHKKNMGYGANQKTCYTYALENNFDYVIMLHPDGQYDPKDLPKFIKSLKSKKADLILGSRFLGNGDKSTPKYKSISIQIITILFNLVLGTKLTEANTGYRGFTRRLLETVPFKKNGSGYIFDPQMIIQSVYFGFNVDEVPVMKKYNIEASSPNFKKSVEHGLENIRLLYEYILHKYNLRRAEFLTNI